MSAMAITKPKPKLAKEAIVASAEDTFIGGAPDAQRQPTGRGIKKGKKEQVTVTIAPIILDRVDELARRMGQSRAAWINMAIYQALESGFGGIKGTRDE